jgi:hypothetical protein
MFLKANGFSFMDPKDILEKLKAKAMYVSSRTRGNLTSSMNPIQIDLKPLERWAWVEKVPVFTDPDLLMKMLRGDMGIFDVTSTFGLYLLSDKVLPQHWSDAKAGRVVYDIIDDVGTVFGILYGHTMDSITAATVTKVKQLVVSLSPEFLYHRVSHSFTDFFSSMSEETETLITYKGERYSKSQAEDVANYLTALLDDTLSTENTSPQAVTNYETNVKRQDTIIRMGDDSYANKPPQRKLKPVTKETKSTDRVVKSVPNNPSSKVKQSSERTSSVDVTSCSLTKSRPRQIVAKVSMTARIQGVMSITMLNIRTGLRMNLREVSSSAAVLEARILKETRE